MADDIFKEVDDEVRAERLRATGRRFGALVAAVLLLVALAAGLWQWRAARARQHAASASRVFLQASQMADDAVRGAAGAGPIAPGASETRAAGLFGQVARSRAPAGLRTLAELREAQLAWRAGQNAKALAIWDRIGDDPGSDPVLRGLASLLWVQHQISSGDPALLKSRLGALSQTGSAWRPMAQELDAELDLRLGHVADARRKLTQLSEDPGAPEGLRNRAAGLNDTLETTKTGG